ncbi:hypothetical protein ACFXAW_18580 [Streptomyces sp. NPDC059445]|uniref:hypothetical protein n=1 Tax=Streptomyces sp. NPDC059445 TaxID=3346832 RepID=UPI00367DC9EA
MAHPPGSTFIGEAGVMQTVSRTGLVTAGLGLGAVGGFVGSLLRERSHLTAARDAAGEGSEEQPSWGVGSYRSRWTTLRTFPSTVARASSGNWILSAVKPR